MKSFESIVGNRKILNHLREAARRKAPAHAYLFEGDDGIGKRLAAECFVAELLCEENSSGPCGRCKSCIQLERGNHPDVKYITHEKSIISVDDIRNQLINEMNIKPYQSDFKIFIVDEAELLNEQAQNALLKTLEEPPEYGIIILLCNNKNAFLQTILSRVVELDFMPAGREEIISFLMREKRIPDYEAKVAAACCNGAPGMAIRWVDSEEFNERREKCLFLTKRLGLLSAERAFETSRAWAKDKEEILFFISFLEAWIRDLLVVKATKKKNYLMYEEEFDSLEKEAKLLSYEKIQEILDECMTLRERLKANVNTEIAFSRLLMQFVGEK